MKVSNKKIVVVVLLIIELTSCYLMYQSSKKNIDLAKVTYEEEITDNMFAMYVENEETGEYDEITNTNIFPEGYILNMDKTGCIDNKGNSIEDILTSKDDKVMVKSNKTVFCYLYFDKDNRVYAKVRSDYKNSNGALLLSETESNEYPVYYYKGDITNNNILYANFCWKMVRTTETGGVKLIYNGVPDTAEDGTLTCDNTGDETQIGTSAFNAGNNSLGYVGYMYNGVYTFLSKGPIYIDVFLKQYNPGTYYYGDTATWNTETNQYELSNSDGSEVTTYVWADNYSTLKGKYTCKSATETSCSEIYYVTYSERWWIHYYGLTSGKTKDDYKIKLGASITDNGDETYTLVNPVEVSKADWPTVHSNYKNYYYCSDLTSETCSDMYYSTSTNEYQLIGYNMANVYKYGNSFTYENGVYTLKDTKEFWDWHNNYNQINNNHYTCFNESGECENVYYIYYTNNTYAYYITLSDGKSVEDAINEMLYAEDVNKTDSTIKKYIDTWYEGAILDKTNEEGLLYSNYLENTIWCNNREIKDLAGWNPNGGNNTPSTAYVTIEFKNLLECNNKLDQFTLKVEAGGTEGYGNNALDYPVALLTYKEVSLSSNYSFLYTNNHYWTMSPQNMWVNIVYEGMASSYGYLRSGNVGYSFGIRPALSLSNKVEITAGDGSASLPYQVILPS